MDFVANQEQQQLEMLKTLGIKNLESLFQPIPKQLVLPKPTIDDGMSEYEGLKWMEALAAKNQYSSIDNYLGAGCYEHHIPAIVDAICSKSEFLTAYTPYQPEASQGMLQAIFEYQSAICALTGMDVANASLYDGASASAEALLMAMRINKSRKKILISQGLHPHYREVCQQYVLSHNIEWIIAAPEKIHDLIDEDTAGILLQSPNFFGILENVKPITAKAKQFGALTILSANPLSYGLFITAGELGVDIAVGDTQPFGIPMQFGGPHAGYIACKTELIRQLPGRIVGETNDSQGRRGFVLTLQAREQHIRREKATSNICTNQANAALASLIAMLWYGKKGICALAKTNYQRACYLRESLKAIQGIIVDAKAPIFNEFVVKFPKPAKEVQAFFRSHKIEPGLHLGEYDSLLKDHFLVAVTETKNKAQLDYYTSVAKKL